MRILFLNQYFPPDPAPTGILLREVADALVARGHDVDLLDAGQAYRQSGSRKSRLRREITALVRLLGRALRRPRAEVVVSASSPPCLLVTATLVARRHRARSIHWAMDLYPEIAVALGEVKSGALSKTVSTAMRWGYRRADAVIALDRDMSAVLARYGVAPVVVRPWVLGGLEKNLPADVEPDPSWTWIYSGNLGRAHEWETLLSAQTLIEKSGAPLALRFQGGGPAWAAAQERAEALQLRQCTWQPYVAEEKLRESLLRCRCCAVTQRPEAQGLLWPSKLALLLSLPRPILWVGPTAGAIADELRNHPCAGIFAPGDATGVAQWLIALSERKTATPALTDAGAERAAGIEKITELILHVAKANPARK